MLHPLSLRTREWDNKVAVGKLSDEGTRTNVDMNAKESGGMDKVDVDDGKEVHAHNQVTCRRQELTRGGQAEEIQLPSGSLYRQ